VGGHALVLQQAGLGQQEGAGAQAGHAARLQGGLAQGVDEARRRRLARRQLARHQQRVGIVLRRRLGEHAHARGSGHDDAAPGQHPDQIMRLASDGIRQLEHGGCHQVQGLESGRQ
jgi:hypothetical protein